MGRLNGVAGSVFCTMGVPDQDPAWTSPRVKTRGHFLSSLRVRTGTRSRAGAALGTCPRSGPVRDLWVRATKQIAARPE